MIAEKIREVLAAHGKLSVTASSLEEEADLYTSGLTSLTTVNVMLALEDEFDIEFTDDMLGRKTFQSIASLTNAIDDLLAQ